MKKYLTILFCSAVISSPAYSSLTCINDYENNDGCTSSVDTEGDCGSLGYSTSDVSGCKQYLKCPFNSRYKICVAGGAGSVDCAELGFTDDDKTSWCKAEDLITCPGTTLTLCAAPDMVAIAPTCEDLGFTQEEKPWCSSLEKCKYDETYTLCNTALNAKTCAERGFTADDKASWCDENSIVECKEADGTILTLCSAPLVECPYGSVEACQEANPWGVCNEVDGCAQVTECADGYVNSGIPPQFTVEDAGTYGNGMHCLRANGCNAELNAYADRAVCTKGISVDPLTLHDITCFVCEEGYGDEEDGGSDTDTDCSQYTLTKCPQYGVCDECPADSSKLKLESCSDGRVEVDGECQCPSGTKYDSSTKLCVPVFASCEDANLVTPQSAEIEKCGSGGISIMSTSGTKLKCYEERCSYWETSTQCAEVQGMSSGPLSIKITQACYVDFSCLYTYNKSSKKFEKGRCITMTVTMNGCTNPILNSNGIVYTSCDDVGNDSNIGKVTGTIYNGGAGGGTCSNGEGVGSEELCKWIYGNTNNAAYQSCILSAQQGIYNISTANCGTLQEYENHN